MAIVFPVKSKLKSTSNKSSTSSSESKYWKSFKPPNPETLETLETLKLPITSISFSPTPPHNFATTQSINTTFFSAATLRREANIKIDVKKADTFTASSFRCDGRLLAAGDISGVVRVVDVRTRLSLRMLKGHARAVHALDFPREDRLHLYSGGDDSVVKYWDVTAGKEVLGFEGHKDYVKCGDVSPVSDQVYVSGSYDHTVKLWDVRAGGGEGAVMEINHEKPVEDVVYLPSGGLLATAGGNTVKIWDVIGGGRLLHTMESHNKTVTAMCVGKIGKESGEEGQQYRILSVSLDGYMKVFDYTKLKITHSMRFPSPLMSIGFSPDCSTRVIGAANGTLYIGKRKVKQSETEEVGHRDQGLWPVPELEARVLRPSYFRYFRRGQNEKPAEGDFAVNRPKKVKLAEHDKLLKKFRHKDALMAALAAKNPENVVAVMEELVARKKLLKCVSNLESEELGLLLAFIQRHSTTPRYATLLMGLAKKLIQMRGEDIKSSDELKGHVRNLKRGVEEEIRIQLSLQEIQGIISPLLRIAARK